MAKERSEKELAEIGRKVIESRQNQASGNAIRRKATQMLKAKYPDEYETILKGLTG